MLDKNDRNNNDNQMIFDEIEMDGGEDGQKEEVDEESNADLPYGIQNVRRDLSYFIRNTRSRANNRDKVSDEHQRTNTKSMLWFGY